MIVSMDWRNKNLDPAGWSDAHLDHVIASIQETLAETIPPEALPSWHKLHRALRIKLKKLQHEREMRNARQAHAR